MTSAAPSRTSTCPDRDALSAFALGKSLPEELQAVLPQHLSDCAACREIVEGAPSDRFLSTLQAAAGANGPAAQPLRLTHGYDIIEPLGRGGCGVVYKARQPGSGRLVALKRLRAGPFADGESLKRFRREAAALARLQHSNIVQVFDVGEQDGEPYLAMEYVAGAPLSDRLAAGPLPPRDAALLIRVLATAIGAGHQAGVVHRDLKPGNVLLEPAAGEIAVPAPDLGAQSQCPDSVPGCGRPRIVDFGLAKVAGDEGTQTGTGMLLGTPAYMAPEQMAEGGDGRLADVYALGAILYECLTGQPPFRGATQLEILHNVRTQEAPRPRTLVPRLPLELEAICLRCLEKDVRRRYATAADLAEDLRCFLAGDPVSARPPGPVRRALRWVRRHPVASVLSTGAAAGIAASFIGLALHQSRLQQEIDRANARTTDANRERELAEQLYLHGMETLNHINLRILELPDAESAEYRELVDVQLAESIRYYQELARVTDKPKVLFDLSQAYQTTGLVALWRGETERGVSHFRLAEQTLLDVQRRYPTDDFWIRELALVRVRLAQILIPSPDEYEAARSTLSAACIDLERLWQAAPDDRERCEHLAWACGVGYQLLLAHGGSDQATDALRREVEIRQRLCRLFPDERNYADELARDQSELQLRMANRP